MRRAALWLAMFLCSAGGCGPPPRHWRARPALIQRRAPPRARPAVIRTAGPAPARVTVADGPAAFVERALRERGLRFGTDGTVRALYEFLTARYPSVPPAQARAGDVVFFALDGSPSDCGRQTHVGLVEAADPGGRITFRERRDGETRRSYATTTAPTTRRDGQGRVLNTFLRPRRPEDPPGQHYFSGEMLCAVVRPA
jgi:hypothetical protein